MEESWVTWGERAGVAGASLFIAVCRGVGWCGEGIGGGEMALIGVLPKDQEVRLSPHSFLSTSGLNYQPKRTYLSS